MDVAQRSDLSLAHLALSKTAFQTNASYVEMISRTCLIMVYLI